jgi:hypothetical protein
MKIGLQQMDALSTVLFSSVPEKATRNTEGSFYTKSKLKVRQFL